MRINLQVNNSMFLIPFDEGNKLFSTASVVCSHVCNKSHVF